MAQEDSAAPLLFLGQQCESDKICVLPEKENFFSSVHSFLSFRKRSLKYCGAVFHGQLLSVSRTYNEVWIEKDLKPSNI